MNRENEKVIKEKDFNMYFTSWFIYSLRVGGPMLRDVGIPKYLAPKCYREEGFLRITLEL